MNANELADWLETGEVEEYDINEAATMLRQQQVEIEALLRFIAERGETGQLIIWKARNK